MSLSLFFLNFFLYAARSCFGSHLKTRRFHWSSPLLDAPLRIRSDIRVVVLRQTNLSLPLRVLELSGDDLRIVRLHLLLPLLVLISTKDPITLLQLVDIEVGAARLGEDLLAQRVRLLRVELGVHTDQLAFHRGVIRLQLAEFLQILGGVRVVSTTALQPGGDVEKLTTVRHRLHRFERVVNLLKAKFE